MNPSETYRNNLGLINEIINSVCQRRAIYGEECDDFRQTVHLKLLENGCARVAKHRGDSSLRTYLVIVINQIFIDELRRKKGRWRPSAMARRLGATATKLETLTSRDKFSLEEAIEILRYNLGAPETPGEIMTLWNSLPNPVPRSFLSEEEFLDPEAEKKIAESTLLQNQKTTVSRLKKILGELLSSMTLSDRLILKLIFFQGRSVVDTARSLNLQAKILYRRRDKILKRLRRELESAGLEWDVLQDFMGWPGIELLESPSTLFHSETNSKELGFEAEGLG